MGLNTETQRYRVDFIEDALCILCLCVQFRISLYRSNHFLKGETFKRLTIGFSSSAMLSCKTIFRLKIGLEGLNRSSIDQHLTVDAEKLSGIADRLDVLQLLEQGEFFSGKGI